MPNPALHPRYRYGTDSQGDTDFSVLICADCSSRTRVVQIPADEQADHNAAHDADYLADLAETPAPDRHAVVKGGHADLEVIRRYLPHNYTADSDGGNVWIHGYDHAGWTLDGYVIPRLASGLYFAKEVEV